MVEAFAEFLQLLQEAPEASGVAGDLACRLPCETFSRRTGFAWANVFKSVNCDTCEKEAKCVVSTKSTMVTRQVLTKEDECDFILQVVNAGGDDDAPFFFGVVGDTPFGFEHLPIGHASLQGSVGISAYRMMGAVVHAGSATGIAPGISNGDTVRIHISRGAKVTFFHESTPVVEVGVGGESKFRCAASLISRGQRVRIMDQGKAAEGSSVPEHGFFGARIGGMLGAGIGAAVLAAAAALANNGASLLPQEKYSPSKGFTWVDILPYVNCDPRDKVATCVISQVATMVTAQVLSPEDECEFLLKMVCVGGDGNQPMTFGVVADVPEGFHRLPVGHPEFKESVGACCGKVRGFFMIDGIKAKSFPPLRDGDLVKVCVAKGSRVRLCKVTEGSGDAAGSRGSGDEAEQISFRMGGNGCFRIGVSFACKGQCAEIIDAVPLSAHVAAPGHAHDASSEEAEADGCRLDVPVEKAMKVGAEVDTPPASDPRLSKMRAKFTEADMGHHCGRVAKVTKVSRRCICTLLDGNEFWWDIELFPSSVRRYCFEGCALSESVVATSCCVCSVCLVRVPKGSRVLRCRSHSYDVCTYCQGLREVPPTGSKVIRGPSWKWEKQDGMPYAEGTCKRAANEEGWVKVHWPGEDNNRYRVNKYYQDVWLARDNGLEGLEPVDEEQEAVAHFGGLLPGSPKEAHTNSSPKNLRVEPFSESAGFSFVEDCAPEVIVDASKKDARAVKDPSQLGSLVTEQVVSASESKPFVFSVLIEALPLGLRGVFAWGLCASQATDFQCHVPGNSNFEGSIGCVLTGGGARIVLHDDSVVAKLPEVCEGDIVGARLGGGKCELLHQGKVIHTVNVDGDFRFVVSLGSAGQHVHIKEGSGEGTGGVAKESVMKRDRANVVPAEASCLHLFSRCADWCSRF